MSPSPSLEMERVKAHMIRGYIMESLGSPEAQAETQETFRLLQHMKNSAEEAGQSEFHAMYVDVAENYLAIAQTSLKSGSVSSARLALDSLARVLPEISEPDRSMIEKSYHALENQMKHRSAGPK